MKLSGSMIQPGLHESKENIYHNQAFSFTGSTETTPVIVGIWGGWKYHIKTTPHVSDDKLFFPPCLFYIQTVGSSQCLAYNTVYLARSILNSVHYFWTQKPITSYLMYIISEYRAQSFKKTPYVMFVNDVFLTCIL